MAIARQANGQYAVKNLKQAKEALVACRELDASIKELMEEHGISEMMADATEMKKAATRWAADNQAERIELGGGLYALLRRDNYGGQWVGSEEDMGEDTPTAVVPLRKILRVKFKRNPEMLKEVWMRVTKRTVDPDELARVVDEKILTADEIAPAFFEKQKSPYLRFYGD